MYGDSSYGSSNGAIPDTRSATEEKGDQKLGRQFRIYSTFSYLRLPCSSRRLRSWKCWSFHPSNNNRLIAG